MKQFLQIHFLAIGVLLTSLVSSAGLLSILSGDLAGYRKVITLAAVAQDHNGIDTEDVGNENRIESLLPATANEARARAIILNDLIRGTLQIMHRDFFDPDDRRRIPSASLEDVFEDVEKEHGIEIRWLGVNAKTLNIDHNPRDDFEKKAAAALDSGKTEFESIQGNRYRRAGLIVLHNVCLKCHVPNRTSLEDRAAGLVISMPFGKKPVGK